MLATGVGHSAAYAFGQLLGLLIPRGSSSWHVRPHVRAHAAPCAEAQLMSGIRLRKVAIMYNVLATSSMFIYSLPCWMWHQFLCSFVHAPSCTAQYRSLTHLNWEEISYVACSVLIGYSDIHCRSVHATCMQVCSSQCCLIRYSYCHIYSYYTVQPSCEYYTTGRYIWSRQPETSVLSRFESCSGIWVYLCHCRYTESSS